jgi:hypothetical protein
VTTPPSDPHDAARSHRSAAAGIVPQLHRRLQAWRAWRLPTPGWLAIAALAMVLALGSWQAQRLARMRPPAPASAGPVAPDSVSKPPAVGTSIDARASVTATVPALMAPDASLATAAASDGASAPPTLDARSIAVEPDPKAGRLVLRCVVRGQITYKDVNASCPNGSAEKVTLFPTEGVGKPK